MTSPLCSPLTPDAGAVRDSLLPPQEHIMPASGSPNIQEGSLYVNNLFRFPENPYRHVDVKLLIPHRDSDEWSKLECPHCVWNKAFDAWISQMAAVENLCGECNDCDPGCSNWPIHQFAQALAEHAMAPSDATRTRSELPFD